MYVFLDWFFLIFHAVFTLFNMFGWIFKQTRKLHLWTVNMTLLSWLGFGLFYGWGYCFLTDWHYQVLYKLGERGLPRSYITYTLDRIFGLSLSDQLVMTWTAIVFVLIVIVTYGQWGYQKFRRS